MSAINCTRTSVSDPIDNIISEINSYKGKKKTDSYKLVCDLIDSINQDRKIENLIPVEIHTAEIMGYKFSKGMVISHFDGDEFDTFIASINLFTNNLSYVKTLAKVHKITIDVAILGDEYIATSQRIAESIPVIKNTEYKPYCPEGGLAKWEIY